MMPDTVRISKVHPSPMEITFAPATRLSRIDDVTVPYGAYEVRSRSEIQSSLLSVNATRSVGVCWILGRSQRRLLNARDG